MTIKELITELNAMVANGEVTEDARITNSERDDIFAITDSADDTNAVVIYF